MSDPRQDPPDLLTRVQVKAAFDAAVAATKEIAVKDRVLDIIGELAWARFAGDGPFTRAQAAAAWNAAAEEAKKDYNPDEVEYSATIRSNSVGDLIVNLACGFLDDPGCDPDEVIAAQWHDLDADTDGFEVWNAHATDLSDPCPWSGQPTGPCREALRSGPDDDGERCPQGCRASACAAPERDTPSYKAAIVATVKGWVAWSYQPMRNDYAGFDPMDGMWSYIIDDTEVRWRGMVPVNLRWATWPFTGGRAFGSCIRLAPDWCFRSWHPEYVLAHAGWDGNRDPADSELRHVTARLVLVRYLDPDRPGKPTEWAGYALLDLRARSWTWRPSGRDRDRDMPADVMAEIDHKCRKLLAFFDDAIARWKTGDLPRPVTAADLYHAAETEQEPPGRPL